MSCKNNNNNSNIILFNGNYMQNAPAPTKQNNEEITDRQRESDT